MAVPFDKTRVTALQVCSRWTQQITRIIRRFDRQTFVLPGGSNCAANTTTELSFTVPHALIGDYFSVQPTAAMPAGLSIVGAYCSVASTPATSNPFAPNHVNATIKVRFLNTTAGILDAAGTYSYFQVGG